MVWCGGKRKTSSVDILAPRLRSNEPKVTYEEVESKSVKCSNTDLPYKYPTSDGNDEHVRKLQNEYENMQKSMINMTIHFARIQFRMRQIMQACPCEREALLQDLERIACNIADDVMPRPSCDELPSIGDDDMAFGEIYNKQGYVLDMLRSRFVDLEEASKSLEESGMEEGDKFYPIARYEETETKTYPIGARIEETDKNTHYSNYKFEISPEVSDTKCCGKGPRVTGYEHEIPPKK